MKDQNDPCFNQSTFLVGPLHIFSMEVEAGKVCSDEFSKNRKIGVNEQDIFGNDNPKSNSTSKPTSAIQTPVPLQHQMI